MSGIAGIIHFDGTPAEAGLIEKMTSAMHTRGPDGIRHWQKDSAALGQCMFRTTPESLEEVQPWCNEDQSLVLVLDGRVDNWIELREKLLASGAMLRNHSDAELVLRSHEIWGEKCLDHLIGEFVFFIWNSRDQQLFAGRDVAGARHFYYYEGNGWFAFASEIKGLLTLDRIKPVLNETRMIDYLIEEYDRDDEVGTFYEGIKRLPAGHAMRVGHGHTHIWRYWDPASLPPLQFDSMEACAEAFLDQLRIAVKCRLRSIGPVSAMLSGGLDSSAIVGLIRKEFRDELSEPLHTVSMVRADTENCSDWKHVRIMLEDGWVQPAVIVSELADETCSTLLDDIPHLDEPVVAGRCLSQLIVYKAAKEQGCSVLLDGTAGDLLFYSPRRSLDTILKRKLFGMYLSMLISYFHHDISDGFRTHLRLALRAFTPLNLLRLNRTRRRKQELQAEDVQLLNQETAKQYLDAKHILRNSKPEVSFQGNDQTMHAEVFRYGLLSFSHECASQAAALYGVEPRSPFSDRRIIEFAIRMPVAAKLAAPWYKFVMRTCMKGILPDDIRWRQDIGRHPGWKFYERLISYTARSRPEIWNGILLSGNFPSFLNKGRLIHALRKYDSYNGHVWGNNLFILAVLARWLKNRVP